MTAAADLAFEIVLHPASILGPGAVHVDPWGRWPTVAVAPPAAATPFAASFDDVLARLAGLVGVFVEPDGSVVGVDTAARAWQFDAQLADLGGRLLAMELKGSCPAAVFDALLACCGWPGEPVMMQLPRAGVFLNEEVFRRHARARWTAGDGRILRPS